MTRSASSVSPFLLFCDRMPADLDKTWSENLPKYMLAWGQWKGVAYGIPIEHGNFQQMQLKG